MRTQQLDSRKYPAQPLRGFWSPSEARKKMPCVSRPDLVDERNRTTDRTARGKRNTITRETKDCGVRALAICANISYDRAHELLAINRRNYQGRTHYDAIIRALRGLGFAVKQIPVVARTLRTVERELTQGVFLVFATRHFVALVNGCVFDYYRGRTMRLNHVWRVTPITTPETDIESA